jgi:exopolysaccharide biosynthesis polyprenyl glycosylphosphotransferase
MDSVAGGDFGVKRTSPGATFVVPLVDVLLTEFALWLAEAARLGLPFGQVLLPFASYLTPTIAVAVALIWTVSLVAFGVPESRPPTPWYVEFRNLFVALAFAVFVLAGFFFLAKIEHFSRLLYAYFVLLDGAFVVGFHLALRLQWQRRLRRGIGVSKVLVVGTGELGRRVGDLLAAGEDQGARLVGFLADGDLPASGVDAARVLGALADLARVVVEHAVDELIFALPASRREAIVEMLATLQDFPVVVRLVPDLLDVAASRATVTEVGGIPLIGIREPAIVGLDRALKRLLDLCGAAVGLLLFGPTLMLAAAIAIRLDSPGPVLFAQGRTGENGRPFTIYKFRTMVADAEARLDEVRALSALSGAAFKVKEDPRRTRVGKLLRRTSIDELPQLFNVLRGDMSLVGPRPEETRVVGSYSAWHFKRLMVKPGITGPMQINGRGDLSLDERVRLELTYIENYSILTDLKILLMTVPAVLSGKGSY